MIYISAGFGLRWSSLFQLIEGVAQGMHCLHEQGIVHLDLNPGNVLLDSDMNPKIIDFGISEVLRDNMIYTRVDGVRGTLYDVILYYHCRNYKAFMKSFSSFSFVFILKGTLYSIFYLTIQGIYSSRTHGRRHCVNEERCVRLWHDPRWDYWQYPQIETT